jgi:hypothetical protein
MTLRPDGTFSNHDVCVVTAKMGTGASGGCDQHVQQKNGNGSGCRNTRVLL